MLVTGARTNRLQLNGKTALERQMTHCHILGARCMRVLSRRQCHPLQSIDDTGHHRKILLTSVGLACKTLRKEPKARFSVLPIKEFDHLIKISSIVFRP